MIQGDAMLVCEEATSLHNSATINKSQFLVRDKAILVCNEATSQQIKAILAREAISMSMRQLKRKHSETGLKA